jgi:hypothetical protein
MFALSEEFGKIEIRMSQMRGQSVIIHAIYQNEIPVLLDRWITKTPVKMFPQEKKCLSLHCCKNITNLFVCLLGMGQVFPVSCKIVLVGYDRSLFR